MDLFEMVLAGLIIFLLAVSLVYTLAAGRQQRVIEGEMDTKIAKPIQGNVYAKNPILFAYGVFSVVYNLLFYF